MKKQTIVKPNDGANAVSREIIQASEKRQEVIDNKNKCGELTVTINGEILTFKNSFEFKRWKEKQVGRSIGRKKKTYRRSR